jgi:hypothetical protein
MTDLNPGSRFRHFKGDTYMVIAVATPVTLVEYHKGLICIGLAHSSEDPTRLWPVYRTPDGGTVLFGWEEDFCDVDGSNLELVIYQSERTGIWWARPRLNFQEIMPGDVARFARIADLHAHEE